MFACANVYVCMCVRACVRMCVLFSDGVFLIVNDDFVRYFDLNALFTKFNKTTLFSEKTVGTLWQIQEGVGGFQLWTYRR